MAKKVQSKGSVRSCCKEEFCDEGEIEIKDLGTDRPTSAKLTGLIELVDRGFRVLKALPMAHLTSFGVIIWYPLMHSNNRERRMKILSLMMQHADAFRYIIGMIAET